jgi:hypothetical protein
MSGVDLNPEYLTPYHSGIFVELPLLEMNFKEILPLILFISPWYKISSGTIQVSENGQNNFI